MIEHLFNMHKALALIPSSENVCMCACGDVTKNSQVSRRRAVESLRGQGADGAGTMPRGPERVWDRISLPAFSHL